MTCIWQTQALRRAVAFLVAVALLLPGLLLVVPSPATAEERALWRDLQTARCLEQGVPERDQQNSCKTCVLCTSPALPRAAAVPDLFSVQERPLPAALVSFVFLHLSRASLAAITVPDPGRGPPA
jgi:hypothetical protein